MKIQYIITVIGMDYHVVLKWNKYKPAYSTSYIPM